MKTRKMTSERLARISRNAERIAKGEKIYERFRRLSESMSF